MGILDLSKTRGAEFTHGAFRAAGLPGVAGEAAMPDELMVKLDPGLPWEEPTQIRFDLLGGGGLGKAQAAGHPEDVRVYGQGRHTEGIGEHDVGGLLAHAGQGAEFGGVAGHPALVPSDQGLSQADEVLRLVPKEARGVDEGLQFRGPRHGQGRGIGIPGEECGGGKVHPGVRALGAQDGGHHELEGVLVLQGAAGFGVGGSQGLLEKGESGFRPAHA